MNRPIPASELMAMRQILCSTDPEFTWVSLCMEIKASEIGELREEVADAVNRLRGEWN